MRSQRYLFVGNRSLVLESMLREGLGLAGVLAAPGSAVEAWLAARSFPYRPFGSRQQLLQMIAESAFDILVSNGCPYILPVSALRQPGQLFVNLHPSLLPDLRGLHPVNGAILFARSGGATCHLMDDGVDTGPIISQVEIPLTADVDLGLLYRLSFMAESDAFVTALKRDFVPIASVAPRSGLVYYSRQESDFDLDWSEAPESLVRRIQAFGIPSQGARFVHRGRVFRVLGAELIANPYLCSKVVGYREGEIALAYDDVVVVRRGGRFLKLKGVSPCAGFLVQGETLGSS